MDLQCRGEGEREGEGEGLASWVFVGVWRCKGQAGKGQDEGREVGRGGSGEKGAKNKEKGRKEKSKNWRNKGER